MPHKHRRKNDGGDKASFNLPPSDVAKPLPVGKFPTLTKSDEKTKPRRRKPKSQDDTPKAFLRLMELSRTGKRPQGLDNGPPPKPSTKKRKRDVDEPSSTSDKSSANSKPAPNEPPRIEAPQIMPGERLADFAIRVDRALPVVGLIGKQRPGGPAGGRQTKHTRKLKKMQEQWREEEKKIREKREEEADERIALEAEEDVLDSFPVGGKKKKKGKRKGDEGDIWAKVEARRLNDIVQAPPTLNLGRERVRAEVENVPRRAGSLRKREEMGKERKSVLEGYRRLMAGKREYGDD